MLDRIRALIGRLHDVQEVYALSDRDLADLGMSREQLLGFLRMPSDITQRVTAMAQIFGVPEVGLKRDHAQWVDLLTVCGHCTDRAACGRVLAKGAAAQPSEAPFCANRGSFTDLAVT